MGTYNHKIVKLQDYEGDKEKFKVWTRLAYNKFCLRVQLSIQKPLVPCIVYLKLLTFAVC